MIIGSLNQGGITKTNLYIGPLIEHNGIDLYEYFRRTVGREPKSREEVYFHFEGLVTNADKKDRRAAIVSGNGWRSSNKLFIENYGEIYGGGGDGGRGSILSWNVTPDSTVKVIDQLPSTTGEDGGTAIYSSVPLTVYNRGSIYGGGGGGGGGPSYLVSSQELTYRTPRLNHVHVAGTSAGGGAPYGKASYPAASALWYAKAYKDVTGDDIILQHIKNHNEHFYMLYFDNGSPHVLTESPTGVMSILSFDIKGHSELSFIDGVVFPGTVTQRILKLFGDIPKDRNKPKFGVRNSTEYSSMFYKAPVGTGTSFKKISTYTTVRSASDGGVIIGGKGGYGNGLYFLDSLFARITYQPFTSQQTPTIFSHIRGGNGGNIGEDGDTFMAPSLYIHPDPSTGVMYIRNEMPEHLLLVSGHQPGRAGYIYEGNVTIVDGTDGKKGGRIPNT